MSASFEKLREALMDVTFADQGDEGAEEVIEVEAYSVEEGLKRASETLGVNISDLEYEIVEHGKRSFLSKKPFRLAITVTRSVETFGGDAFADFDETAAAEALKRDLDGVYRIKITRIGLMLKVILPKGKGQRVRVEDVLIGIREKGVDEFDKSKIAKIVRSASGEYIKVCDFEVDERSEGRVVIEISEDEMKAFMTLVPPKPRGRVLDIDDIHDALHDRNVVVGVIDDVILKCIEEEEYNIMTVIAEGIKPVHGENAKIAYNFRTEKKVHLEEDEKGQVNFKDLDLVENVVAGQLLATKVQATEGQPGRTITNRLLEAKTGKDIDLVPGKNTELSSDGMNIIATINGQVIFSNEKVNVEPIYEVKGDVDMHTGNILFLGTVIVKGNVEDGFSIKAAGDIEIRGSVGKCLLDAEGDVNIKQGVMGKLDGTIKAGGSVWAKFLEQVTVIADKNVFVQDGIMHCHVDATEKVICFGKRATIVGGRIRAGEIVNTKTLGSVSFTETIVEVGVDPKSRQRLFELDKEQNKNIEELDKLNTNIGTLENQQKVRRHWSEEKREMLDQMHVSRDELSARMSEIREEMDELKSYLKLLKSIGKTSVLKYVYSGVRIGIKDTYFDVKNEFKYVTFVLESGRIQVKKYEDIDLEEILGKRVR
jgi:uncharacterized protein (DUF342 family)